MMAVLFVIYLICLILMLFHFRTTTFTIVIINLILCFLMLLHHATDILKIQL